MNSQSTQEDTILNTQITQASSVAESVEIQGSIAIPMDSTGSDSLEVSSPNQTLESAMADEPTTTEPARIHHLLADSAPALRPGVTNHTLRENGVTICGPGRTCPDLKIPYYTFDGSEEGRQPMDDGNGGEFFRKRLDRPASEGGKYSQAAGSPVRAYFPLGLAELLRQHRYVIITEGEFKAMSLVEAGYPAVAIGGIYNFRLDDRLLPELDELFDWIQKDGAGLETIYFLGDADTAINGQFSDAAIKLRDALSAANISVPLALPRMPARDMNTRKGIDDLRAAMAEGEFVAYMEELIGGSICVPADLDAKDLMMILFNHDRAGIEQLCRSATPTQKSDLLKKLARLANAVGIAGADKLADFACETGLVAKPKHFRSAMNEQAKKQAEEMESKRVRQPAPMFYCPNGNKNYLYVGNNGFTKVDRTGALNYLHERGHSKKAPSPGELSEAERELTKADKAPLDWTGPLAGHKAGIREDNGLRLLVTKSPKLLNPVEGDWDAIKWFIETRLDYDPALDPRPAGEKQATRVKTQSPYFYGWLAHAAKSLYLQGGRFVPSQALVLCGGTEVGKNTLQEELITELLGRRQADPFDHMEGSSSFNGELAGAEHWRIADKQSSAKYADREKMKSCLKEGCVNRTVRINAKHQQPINVEVWRRISISMNESAECLRVLPSLSSDFADKLIILHVVGPAFHGPGTPCVTYQDWRTQIQAELPAFLHYLLHEHVIEPAMWSLRYGVQEYHDPEMVQRMHEQSQEGRLEALLDAHLFNRVVPPGEMTAGLIYARIGEQDGYEDLAAIGCESTIKMGTLLGKLVEQKPERFSMRILRGNKLYLIAPPIVPPDEIEVPATEVDVTGAEESGAAAA